ncbi:sigma 54-interacting transcriptional regulator [Aurantivibrio plasticivorans]
MQLDDRDELISEAFWHSPIPLLLIHPINNTILASNFECCKFLGDDVASLRSRSVTELIPESVPELIAFTQEAFETGSAWSDHFYITRRTDHQKIRVEISAKQLKVSGQSLLELSLQDAEELLKARNRAEAHRHYRSGISHWNRIEKVFQEFERENRLILDAAGEGIYGVDAEGRTTFLNPAAEKLLGWRAEELIGKNIHDAIHSKHSDGRHYHAEDCYIYRAFREGVVNSVDNEVFWTKSGKPIEVEYTSTPIKDNGHVVGAVVIFRDVTDKRYAQQQLIAALQEVETLKQRLEMENAYLQEELSSEFNHHQIVGNSIAIKSILQKIELVAPTQATVLINGESGTGKELIARAIHDLSERSKRSLIRVNCAAIPADLFESEFFGHSKGAFTGATADRPGRFELADGGTLFLDEVGEIPLSLQGKLLRVLQEQQFERVGEATTRDVNVRIIAATNRDLKALVDAGEFREDLYFRLNVFPVESIPLRGRLDDIPLLAQHFLERAARRANKSNLKIPLSQVEKLKHYHWPGNIRELENVIERQVILATSDTIRFDEFFSQHAKQLNSQPAPTPSPVSELMTAAELKAQERNSLIAALNKTRGKVFGKDGAAELLGLAPTTLASKIKRLGIDTSLFKNKEPEPIV